jgi:hypothetical protein
MHLLLAACLTVTGTLWHFVCVPVSRAADNADAAATAVTGLSVRPPAEQELFGMVVRDPFYEFNTDPVHFPMAPNRTALERQAVELAGAGVRWIRMEFFADYDGTVSPGDINWNKYDWFIRELAPRYGFKVLALLNVGMVAYNGQTLRTLAFNDPPDGAGTDPEDGSNHFIRVFTARAQAIAARYGPAISAYEIINEPNISWDLWMDSRNSSAEIKPERYAALLASAYRAIKSVSPHAQVITGGMMLGSPPEGQDHDQFDYLYQMYVSPWVERYRSLGYDRRPGWNVVPWDGVAVHPYSLDAPQLFIILKEFARKLRDRGDFKSRLWITEIGTQATPPDDPHAPPTPEEVEQARYLRSIYQGILDDPELRSVVAHVFWFKYEDFVPGNYTHNYGLVRLAEAPSGKDYDPSGRVWVHKLAYKTYQELALGYSIADRMERPPAFTAGEWGGDPGNNGTGKIGGADGDGNGNGNGSGSGGANNDLLPVSGPLYFEQTGQAIAPVFARYWQEKGGIERFGYPISRPMVVRGYLSQFFERAVFEYHPEYAGTPNEVLLRLVGVEYTRGMKFDKADPASLPPDRVYFPQTGHSLGGVFLRFWQQTGGLEVYGYPISEEVTEVSPTDGRLYTVQYFERNRFEYHPEHAGTRYEVMLGLLGANLLKTNTWWR